MIYFLFSWNFKRKWFCIEFFIYFNCFLSNLVYDRVIEWLKFDNVFSHLYLLTWCIIKVFLLLGFYVMAETAIWLHFVLHHVLCNKPYLEKHGLKTLINEYNEFHFLQLKIDLNIWKPLDKILVDNGYIHWFIYFYS